MYIKVFSFIICMSLCTLLKGVNQTVIFDLTKLQNNVGTATLVSESDGAVTMEISNSSDWDGNTNAINVDNNGLLVTDTPNSSFDITFNTKGYEYVITGFSLLDASTVTSDFNVLRFSDVLNQSGATDIMLVTSSGISGPGDYEVDGSVRKIYDSGVVLRLSSLMNAQNIKVRFSKLELTLKNVPEPATYALLLGGLVLLVSLARRVRL